MVYITIKELLKEYETAHPSQPCSVVSKNGKQW